MGFSNQDLRQRLEESGRVCRDKVWRIDQVACSEVFHSRVQETQRQLSSVPESERRLVQHNQRTRTFQTSY